MRDPVFRIVSRVAEHYGLTVERMLSRARSKSVVEARHIAMWICRERLGLSYPELGVEFGNRVHESCLRGVRKIGAATGRVLEARAELFEATKTRGAA